MATIRNRSNDPNAPAWEARVRIPGYPTKTAPMRLEKRLRTGLPEPGVRREATEITA